SASELTPQDLRDEPLILLARHTQSASYITNAFGDHHISPNIVSETQPSFAAASMAAHGCGIAIVDELSALAMGSKVAAVPFTPEIPFDICILKPKNM